MKKTIVMVLAVALVLCVAIGGTLAWLMDTTGPVKNTFTYGDINIELDETTGEEYKMVPGCEIAKDPKVTVEADSEACWLFVKVEESANFKAFMTYIMADGWTALDGADGVYYREVAASDTDQEFAVLKGDQVQVLDDVTKQMLNALDANDAENYPTLTFTAYAIQQAGFADAAAAWDEINPTP